MIFNTWYFIFDYNYIITWRCIRYTVICRRVTY